MNHIIYPVESPVQPFLITHITYEKPDPLIPLEFLRHIPLLHLIPGINDYLFRVILFQCHWNKSIPKRTSATGYKDC